MNYYTAPHGGPHRPNLASGAPALVRAPGAPARYYAPFISPPENRVLIKKKMAELDPAANPGAPVIPPAAGQRRRSGRLDDRRASEDGLH